VTARVSALDRRVDARQAVGAVAMEEGGAAGEGDDDRHLGRFAARLRVEHGLTVDDAVFLAAEVDEEGPARRTTWARDQELARSSRFTS